MKKIVLVMAILFASLSLNAAKMAGPDENGRIYNTAYFDILTDVQSPVLGVISYSKRAGGFDWTKLNENLANFSANQVTYKVTGRIEIPSSIETDSVYVSLGKNIKFWNATCCDSEYTETCNYLKNKSRTVFKLSSAINGKEVLASDAILAKTKKDAFGGKYVEFEIKFYIMLASDKDYRRKVKAKILKLFNKNFNQYFSNFKIQVAPKSRTYDSKWVEPKIYVLDE